VRAEKGVAGSVGLGDENVDEAHFLGQADGGVSDVGLFPLPELATVSP
jgi:hypothetical protein